MQTVFALILYSVMLAAIIYLVTQMEQYKREQDDLKWQFYRKNKLRK